MSDNNSTIVEKVAKLKSAITDLKNNLSTIGLIDGNEPLSSYAETVSSNFDSEEIKDVFLYTTVDEPHIWRKSKNFEFDTSRGRISAFTEITAASQVIIPQSVNETDVTVIGDGQLSGLKDLTYIYFPNTLTSFGLGGLQETSCLQNINFPDNSQLTKIRTNTFFKCKDLTNIDIPEGVVEIEQGSFQYCQNLKYLSFPNSLTSIGNYCFQQCSSVEYMKIATNVNIIGTDAFSGCSSLSCVKILSADSNTVDSVENFKNKLITAGINENVAWIFDHQ